VATSRRGLLDATASVALAAALLDGVMAFARDAEAAWSFALVTLPGATVAFVLLVGLARALAVALWSRTPAPARAWLAGVVFSAAGALFGLALFSGTGVRRLGLQRPLVALVTVLAAALGVAHRSPRGTPSHPDLAAQRRGGGPLLDPRHGAGPPVRPAPRADGGHRRQALWCSAASRGVRVAYTSGAAGGSRARGDGPLPRVLVGLARSHRARSAVRQVAPLGQYVARGRRSARSLA
jgi:hypothetical protein